MSVSDSPPSVRLNQHHLENLILDEVYHHFDQARVTVCCLILVGDHSIVADVVCANPDNFDRQIGRTKARQKALAKLMKYERYWFRRMHGKEETPHGRK